MRKYTLINSIRSNTQAIQRLQENCAALPVDTVLLTEAADKYIGHVIAALKAGKNPFETVPGSKDVIAGLMLLAKETNRDALNMNQKKFNLLSQELAEKDALKKYVANLAKKHGESLMKSLEAYVAEKEKRDILTKKLVQLQNAYSEVKQKTTGSGADVEPQEVRKKIAV